MIRRIEALGYRSLRHVELEVGGLQILFGPNGSGKSTFLDVVGFLSDLVDDGIEVAALERAPDWRDLLWKSSGECFELVVEAEIPEGPREQLADSAYRRCRYQVSIGALPAEGASDAFGIREETLGLRPPRGDEADQPQLFPEGGESVESILDSFKTRNTKTVVHKIPEGHDHFYDETGAGWSPTFKLGPRRSALANLPEDPAKFPVASWFKRSLVDRTPRLIPQSDVLRRPAPPGQGRRLRSDAGNLAWVVHRLAEEHPQEYDRWLERLRADFPGIASVDTTVREEDRHCYLTVEHPSGHRVHSWGVSEGTLRSLVYSILPHTSAIEGTVLLEEPENGIHPDGVRALYGALGDAADVQILAASHSPVLAGVCDPDERLDFSSDARGATKIETRDG